MEIHGCEKQQAWKYSIRNFHIDVVLVGGKVFDSETSILATQMEGICSETSLLLLLVTGFPLIDALAQGLQA